MKQLSNAILIALSNVRTRFFHTFLSIIGIVVGVAALVGTLSLIDGMEKYANDQISNSTTINTLVLETVTHQTIDGIRFKKPSFTQLDHTHLLAIKKEIPFQFNYLIQQETNEQVKVMTGSDTVNIGTRLIGLAIDWKNEDGESPLKVKLGRTLSPADQEEEALICLVNDQMAARLATDSTRLETAIGQYITWNRQPLQVVGVIDKEDNDEQKAATVVVPFGLKSTELPQKPATILLQAKNVEEVNPIKTSLTAWLEKSFPGKSADFKVSTNEGRIKQAEKGFMIFRVVMGMIVGLSVLVGGIGVMNVMLISVNERTSEIGISKALGAKRRDIFIQFLSESVTISALGSALGLTLGILATMAFVPIIKALTNVPFEAAYTLNTLVVIGVIALVVGVVFGTYPATRASKLDPVEAMRRE